MALIENNQEFKKPTKAEVMRKRAAEQERDYELVTGIFRYLEHPGGTLRFRYHKYPQDNNKMWELTDGQRYKLPRMIVRHLNNGVYYLSYKHLDNKLGEAGVHNAMIREKSRFDDGSGAQNNMTITSKVHRCEFRSLDFMDEDDLSLQPSKLVTITAT